MNSAEAIVSTTPKCEGGSWEPPRRPLGLRLCGVALLGYTELGVVDAEDGLSDELDCLAGDFLLIRVFAGALLALNQDRIALLEGAGELGEVAPCGHAEPVRGFMPLIGLVHPLLCGGVMCSPILVFVPLGHTARRDGGCMNSQEAVL